ncbi:hypothetical protein BC830DRAFT_623332 [Chytriomyces sp. MP71]|nr:hypothetical protein BC830DRAFT_623332 [Chytriomyces sp. MP71]
MVDSVGNELNPDILGYTPKRSVVCGVQYVILVDRVQKTIVTELWAEPVTIGTWDPTIAPYSTDVKVLFRELHESIAKEIVHADSRLFERLHSFDRIYGIGLQGADVPIDSVDRSRRQQRRTSDGRENVISHGLENMGNKVAEVVEPGRTSSIMHTRFNIEAVLKKARFSCIRFTTPLITNVAPFPSLVPEDTAAVSFSPLLAIKSDGDLLSSRNTSPSINQDSPRASVSTDQVSFYRRSSQPQNSKMSSSSVHVSTIKPMLSIGLSWDIVVTATPAARTRLLLYKFLQNALGYVTDSEVAFRTMSRKASRSNSIRDAIEALDMHSLVDANMLDELKDRVSALYKHEVLCTKLEDSVCFVKIRGPEQFVLVFVPKVIPIMDMYKGSYLGISIVECTRMKVHNTMSGKERLSSFGFDRCIPEVIDTKFDCAVKVEASELRNVSDGAVLVNCNNNSTDMAEDEYQKDYIDLFIGSVSEAYSVAHCKSVYAALLQSIEVDTKDLARALTTCEEVTIEIDITSYLNIFTLRHQRMNSSDVRLEERHILNNIRGIISRRFSHLNGYENLHNVYFFNPDDGEAVTPQRIECADTPLFIRTEVIFKKGAGNQADAAFLPIVAIPTSYKVSGIKAWDEVDDDLNSSAYFIDFSPPAIGTPENLLASNDGTVATLRIVCLALVRPGKLDAPYDDSVGPELYENALYHPRLLLSRDKIDTLYETVEQVKVALNDEVISGLLDLPSKFEDFTINYIRTCLNDRHPIPGKIEDKECMQKFACSSSCVVDLGLSLVKDIQDKETDLISKEFANFEVQNVALTFRQLGTFFCITGEFDAVNDISAETFTEPKIILGLEPTLNRGPFGDSLGGLHGLGISLNEDKLSESLHISVTKKNWVLISFSSGSARVWCFSRFTSPSEKSNTLAWVRNSIRDTCDRVSRLILLENLKRTHRARFVIFREKFVRTTDRTSSKFLIEAQPNDESSDEEDEDEISSKDVSLKSASLVANQFACPLVSSHKFPIHWRVKPLHALSTVISSIAILAIANRKNMFVFEAGGIIVYFKLSLSETEVVHAPPSAEASRTPSVDDISASMESISISNASPMTGSPLTARKAPTIVNPPVITSQKSADSSMLLLEFFGVDGPLVANDFVSLIDAKLSALTQREISTYMSRNLTSVRLTSADVDFILPPSKKPQKTEFFKLPRFVADPLKFLLYFKQTLLTKLSSLPSTEIGTALKNYYERDYGFEYPPEKFAKHELNCGEFAFVYNCIQSRSNTSFETIVGAGTALVSFVVLTPSRKVLGALLEPLDSRLFLSGSATTFDEFYDTVLSHASSLRILDMDSCLHDESPNMIAVSIWQHGTMNISGIMNFAFKSFCDTALDYTIEAPVHYFTDALTDMNPTSHVPHLEISASSLIETCKVDASFGSFFDKTLAQLKVQAQIGNTAVEELSSPIKLLGCIMDELANETKDLLMDASASFNPVMIERAISEVPSLSLYSPTKSGTNLDTRNQVLIIVGIHELQELYGCDVGGKLTPVSSNTSGSMTPTSIAPGGMENSFTEASQKQSFRSKSGLPLTSAEARRSSVDAVQIYPKILVSSGKEIATRNGFLLMRIESTQISVATYNLNKSSCSTIFNHLLRVLTWNNIRMQFLENGHRIPISQSLRDKQYPQHLASSAPISEYSTSYGGIGGLGQAAMKHFERRTILSDVPEPSDADKLRRMYDINSNALQKCAVSLLDSFVRNIDFNEAMEPAAENIGQWGATGKTNVAARGRADSQHFAKHPSKQSLNPVLTTAEMAAILLSVRFHFVHYPIFFSELRETFTQELTRDADEQEAPDSDLTQNQDSQRWFKEMLYTFSSEYTCYLRTHQFEPYSHEKTQVEIDSLPSFAISPGNFVEVEPVYLHKRVTGGALILQIGVEGVCVAVNLYMLKFPTETLNPFDIGMRYKVEKESERLFKEECIKSKSVLHVHSFSYDFHVRYFQHILEKQPNSQVDVVDVMRTFEKYNANRFVYARSRMVAGECMTESQSLSVSLFQYILKNPHIYKFKSVIHNGTPTACFLTSEYPDFASTRKQSLFDRSDFCYTVVLYMSRELAPHESGSKGKDTVLRLRYFLLIIDRKNTFPLNKLDSKKTSFVNQSHSEAMKEYLSGGCYLGDIVKFAVKKIEALVEEVCKLFRLICVVLTTAQPNF